MRFGHINIRAPLDLLQREEEFCCQILGLHRGHRPDFESKGYWLYDDDEAIIHLSVDENYTPSHQDNGYMDHIAFYKDNEKAFINLLDNYHIAYTKKYISEINATQIRLQSPLGIDFEILFILSQK